MVKASTIKIDNCPSIEEMVQEPTTITRWLDRLEKISAKYGPGALLEFDAGYNNITVQLVKKIRKNKA